jgi:hypothetical protein
LHFKTSGKLLIFLEEFTEYTSYLIQKNPKDVNMKPAGLGNTSISTGYIQKSPLTWSLIRGSVHPQLGPWRSKCLYPHPEYDKGSESGVKEVETIRAAKLEA